MNKKLISMLVILSILAFTFATAFTPPKITRISLLSVNFMREKGVTLKFLVDGNFRKSELQGSVTVDGKSLRLYCNYGGDPAPVVVTCTSAKGTAKFAGGVGLVSIAGRTFRIIVPARPSSF